MWPSRACVFKPLVGISILLVVLALVGRTHLLLVHRGGMAQEYLTGPGVGHAYPPPQHRVTPPLPLLHGGLRILSQLVESTVG